MGRNTVFTKEIGETIVGLVRRGAYLETAAAEAGVGAKVVRDWVRRGVNGDEEFERFAFEYQKAQAECEHRTIFLVQRAAYEANDWRAAAWFLEKRFPKRWGALTGIDDSTETIVVKLDRGQITATSGKIDSVDSASTGDPWQNAKLTRTDE